MANYSAFVAANGGDGRNFDSAFASWSADIQLGLQFEVTAANKQLAGYYFWWNATANFTPFDAALWQLNVSTGVWTLVPNSHAVWSGTPVAGWNLITLSPALPLTQGQCYCWQFAETGNFFYINNALGPADTTLYPSGVTRGPINIFGDNNSGPGQTNPPPGTGFPNSANSLFSTAAITSAAIQMLSTSSASGLPGIDILVQDTVAGPTITTGSLPNGQTNVAYSATLAATGGTTPYTWSVSTGSLPVGLTLNASTGVISGTPTGSGTSSFTITVTDANSLSGSANLAITISSVPVLQVTFVNTVNGVSNYNVLSSLNDTGGAGAQPMRVLIPDAPDSTHYPHRFLWLLPVEPGQGSTFGDPIAVIQGLNAHNQYNLTCIQPGFPIDPWYANNPNDPTTQQEAFLVSELKPWVATNLAITGSEEHGLIGFSKSGNGGQQLFLRHLNDFAFVASWDFPGDATTYNQFDGAPVYGTQTNFAANYELTEANVAGWIAGSNVTTVKRMWIGGFFTYATSITNYETAVLNPLGIDYDGTWSQLDVAHAWESDWVAAALASLVTQMTTRPLTEATGRISLSAVHGKITVS